jgi:signal transduction histidine kinase
MSRIRTPIAGVIGMGEMLMDTRLSDEQRSLVVCVQVSASNLLVILNDILDISKIESGKMQLECMGFNLAQIVQQTGKLFEPNARKKSITFEISSNILYEVEMRGDPGRIQQVLSNLISNAITSHLRAISGLRFKLTAVKQNSW